MNPVQAISTALFENSQSELCGGLLGLFLAATLGSGKSEAFVPDFDFERLLVLRSERVVKALLDDAEAAFLKPLLQGRLVVGTFETFDFALERGVEQSQAFQRRREEEHYGKHGREAGALSLP